jgi:hypothetical protein
VITGYASRWDYLPLLPDSAHRTVSPEELAERREPERKGEEPILGTVSPRELAQRLEGQPRFRDAIHDFAQRLRGRGPFAIGTDTRHPEPMSPEMAAYLRFPLASITLSLKDEPYYPEVGTAIPSPDAAPAGKPGESGKTPSAPSVLRSFGFDSLRMMEYDPFTGRPRYKGTYDPQVEALRLALAFEGSDPIANHRGTGFVQNWGQVVDMLKKDGRLDGGDRFAISVQLITAKPLPSEALGDTVARVVRAYLAEKKTPKTAATGPAMDFEAAARALAEYVDAARTEPSTLRARSVVPVSQALSVIAALPRERLGDKVDKHGTVRELVAEIAKVAPYQAIWTEAARLLQ